MVTTVAVRTPSVEHLILLRSLADCVPGTGVVVGNPGPTTLQTFRDCLLCGWVECADFGCVQVWKVTRAGRSACYMATNIELIPCIAAEC